MNSQYIQWISGPRRGEVESAEMMQDGQTFEDVVILSNGRRVPMVKVGKEFIVLPNANAALKQLDLDIMYPAEQPKKQKQKIDKSHQEILGLDIVEPAKPEPKVQQKPKRVSSFASDLLERAKKSNMTIPVNIDANMPAIAFFDMINQTFDESTVNEVIDLMVESVDVNEIRNSIKQSIINFYGEEK